ncbi:MAG: type VI secretion system protein TssA [Rubrivivax sp.]
MSDIAAADNKVATWLQPLGDEAAPCGADLEYDNDFLAISQAAAGKPESQFGPAEPADWRGVVDLADTLFERTRDLRVAVFWVRAILHTMGYAALPVGLKLLIGLAEQHWDHVHPMPDPDDGDPYARVNALTVLRENEGLIGDLREARLVADRSIGELTVRHVEVALGLSPARSGETDIGSSQIGQMLAAAVAKTPELRGQCNEALALVKQLISLLNDKLGIGVGPDLRPLYTLVNGVVGLLPVEEVAEEGAADEEGGGEDGAPRSGGKSRGLSGSVTSREEAVRAIDMVCDYLMKAEPTNPAPLFLRRGRQLINHDFLQLMKVLAPDSLSEVARVVGVDPDTVETPGGS